MRAMLIATLLLALTGCSNKDPEQQFKELVAKKEPELAVSKLICRVMTERSLI